MITNKIYKNIFIKNHPFQLLNRSGKPFQISLLLGCFVISYIEFLHSRTFVAPLVFFALIILYHIERWFYDMNNDSTKPFVYNKSVGRNILMGVILFIISEIFLFISVFWAFFHSSLNPSIFIGAVWPPIGIELINPWSIPFLNTLILIISGITVNSYFYSLKALSFSNDLFFKINFDLNNVYLLINLIDNFYNMISSDKSVYWSNFISNQFEVLYLSPCIIDAYKIIKILWKSIYNNLLITIILGYFFLLLQFYEYTNLTFSLGDGIYGSIFYLLTGLHGIHVFLGFMMLDRCFSHLSLGYFDENSISHIFSICAVWYWHFVDVVWLFLFIFLYIWSH